jgi:hypothetical protein
MHWKLALTDSEERRCLVHACFGVYPTWEGLTAQLLAATFVLGSYVAAEQLRKRRRRVILARA